MFTVLLCHKTRRSSQEPGYASLRARRCQGNELTHNKSTRKGFVASRKKSTRNESGKVYDVGYLAGPKPGGSEDEANDERTQSVYQGIE